MRCHAKHLFAVDLNGTRRRTDHPDERLQKRGFQKRDFAHAVAAHNGEDHEDREVLVDRGVWNLRPMPLRTI
jgi:hypothetical protein